MPKSQIGTIDFTTYKAIRDEIAHEDMLAGTRLSWFIASQAFLLSALATAHTARDQVSPNPHNDFYFPLIPILAIASCILIMLGIVGGAVAMHRWRRLLRHLINEDPALPAIRHDGWIMRCGWTAPLLLPFIFLIAWTYLLVTGMLA